MNRKRARTVVTVAAAVFVVSALLVAAVTATVPSGDEQEQVAGPALDENTTVLELDPGHERVELEPGESEEFVVEVTNEEQDEAVEIEPEIVELEEEFDTDWISIEPDSDEVEPNETVDVGFEVEVPEDAEDDRQNGLVGFTDDEVAYPTLGSIPVNSFDISISVDIEPAVEVDTDHERVTHPAGESHEFEFEVTNDGDEAVPVEPEYDHETAERRSETDVMDALPAENIEMDSPEQVAPGETETVTVEADVPDGFSGTYVAPIDLGVEDPARSHDHWRSVHLRLNVWNETDEPETVEFDVDDTETLEFEVSADKIDGIEPPEIDVTLYNPDGEEVSEDTQTVTGISSSVSVGEDDDGSHGSPEHSVVETVEEPDDGTWTAEIDVSNVPRFGYEARKFE